MNRVKSILLLTLILVLVSGSCFAAETKTYRKTPRNQVELYVTSWCPYCKQAAAYLDQQGIAYQMYDVEKDSEAARRMTRLAGSGGIPFAVINGVKIKGWSEDAYAAALRKRQ